MLGVVTNSIVPGAGCGPDAPSAGPPAKADAAQRSFLSILREREDEGRSAAERSEALGRKVEKRAPGSEDEDDEVEDAVSPPHFGEETAASPVCGRKDILAEDNDQDEVEVVVDSSEEALAASAGIAQARANAAQEGGPLSAKPVDRQPIGPKVAASTPGYAKGLNVEVGAKSAEITGPHLEGLGGGSAVSANASEAEAILAASGAQDLRQEPMTAQGGLARRQPDVTSAQRALEFRSSKTSFALGGDVAENAAPDDHAADQSTSVKLSRALTDIASAHINAATGDMVTTADPGVPEPPADPVLRTQSYSAANQAGSLLAEGPSASERQVAAMMGSPSFLRGATGHERLPSTEGQEVGLTSELKLVTNPELRGAGLAQNAAPQVARQVAAQIADAIGRSAERAIDVILNPSELGRVRITLSHGEAGMIVNVAAERAETLDLMRRHGDVLGHEFDSAGYEGTAFSFSQDDRAQDGRVPSDASDVTMIDQPTMLEPSGPGSGRVAIVAIDRLDIRF